jgi:hypothetical protein
MRYSSQPSAVKRLTYVKETMTNDGRDLSGEEFRVIPGLTRYEITKDGDVRNIRTGRLLAEIENKQNGNYSFSLWKDDGKTTHRSWQRLVWLAYPELEPEKVASVKPVKLPKERQTHCKNGHEFNEANTRISPDGRKRECRTCTNARARQRRKEASIAESKERVGHNVWRIANDFPLYEINKLGAIREITSGRMLESSRNNRGRFYHLKKGNRVIAIQRTALLNLTFPKRSESA